MSDIPNSNRFNEELAKAGMTRQEAKEKGITTIEEIKSKKVVTSPVKVKKKSGAHKVADMFISEDVAKVKEFVIMDVLVPSIKDAISSIVKNGVDIILYGEPGHSKKRTRVDRVSFRDYTDYSKDKLGYSRDYRSPISRGTYDYADIIFESRGEAESVLMAMDDTLEEYKIVKVSDYYEFADVSADSACFNYGWTDLRSANIIKVRDGWMIKLPRPLPID